MSFGLSAAAIGGIAAGVGAVGGAVISANGAKSAAAAQAGAEQAGIAQQQQQFAAMQALLKPYVDAGTGALPGYNAALDQLTGTNTQLGNLTGANGIPAQKTAISGLTSSPLYTSAMQLGQQAILQNASATGALRGGNTIASLGYLPSQILAQSMQQQIGNLDTSLQGDQAVMGGNGQLISIGQNAAAGTGNAGISTGNNITQLLGAIGQAQAGGMLGTSNAISGGLNSLSTLLGGSTGQNALAALMNSTAMSGGSAAYTSPVDMSNPVGTPIIE